MWVIQKKKKHKSYYYVTFKEKITNFARKL